MAVKPVPRIASESREPCPVGIGPFSQGAKGYAMKKKPHDQQENNAKQSGGIAAWDFFPMKTIMGVPITPDTPGSTVYELLQEKGDPSSATTQGGYTLMAYHYDAGVKVAKTRRVGIRKARAVSSNKRSTHKNNSRTKARQLAQDLWLETYIAEKTVRAPDKIAGDVFKHPDCPRKYRSHERYSEGTIHNWIKNLKHKIPGLAMIRKTEPDRYLA